MDVIQSIFLKKSHRLRNEAATDSVECSAGEAETDRGNAREVREDEEEDLGRYGTEGCELIDLFCGYD